MQTNNPADILQTEYDNNLLYNHKRAQGIYTLRFFVCGNIEDVKTNVPRGTNLSFKGLKKEKTFFGCDNGRYTVQTERFFASLRMTKYIRSE